MTEKVLYSDHAKRKYMDISSHDDKFLISVNDDDSYEFYTCAIILNDIDELKKLRDNMTAFIEAHND